MSPVLSVFIAGMVLSLSLIIAIGPQNAHLLRMGLARRHVALTVAICLVSDVLLIALGVLGLAQLGGLSDKLLGAVIGAGALFLLWYAWQALQRALQPGARCRPARWPRCPTRRPPAARRCSPPWPSPGSIRMRGSTPRC